MNDLISNYILYILFAMIVKKREKRNELCCENHIGDRFTEALVFVYVTKVLVLLAKN